ncbi:hypothetical protein [Alishewanella longhuensis]
MQAFFATGRQRNKKVKQQDIKLVMSPNYQQGSQPAAPDKDENSQHQLAIDKHSGQGGQHGKPQNF